MELRYHKIFARDGNQDELGKTSQYGDITHAILYFPMPSHVNVILSTIPFYEGTIPLHSLEDHNLVLFSFTVQPFFSCLN